MSGYLDLGNYAKQVRVSNWMTWYLAINSCGVLNSWSSSLHTFRNSTGLGDHIDIGNKHFNYKFPVQQQPKNMYPAHNNERSGSKTVDSYFWAPKPQQNDLEFDMQSDNNCKVLKGLIFTWFHSIQASGGLKLSVPFRKSFLKNKPLMIRLALVSFCSCTKMTWLGWGKHLGLD